MTDRDNVFDFVCEHKYAHDGNSPSLREIGEACGIPLHIASTHLKSLASEGSIIVPPGQRNIEIVGAKWTFTPEEIQ